MRRWHDIAVCKSYKKEFMQKNHATEKELKIIQFERINYMDWGDKNQTHMVPELIAAFNGRI